MSDTPQNIVFVNDAVTTVIPDVGGAMMNDHRIQNAGNDEADDNGNNAVATLDDLMDNNEVTIEAIRDGIVSAGTLQSYVGDILKFLEWIMNEEDIVNVWMTEYGINQLADVLVQRENESDRVYRSRKLLQMKVLLRDAFEKKSLT